MRRREELLPPRYVVLPVRLLPGDELSRSVLMTGMIIWSLGWRYNYRRTEAVTRAELCELCQMTERGLYAHLRALRDAGVIDYTRPDRDGMYVFELVAGDDEVMGARDRRGYKSAVRGDAATCISQEYAHPSEISPPPITANFCSDVDMIGVVGSHAQSDCVNSTNQQQQFSHVFGFGGECEGGAASVQKIAVIALAALGVLEPTRTELAGLAHVDEEYLEAWSGYMHAHPELGVGWLVVQVRAGERPPVGDGGRDPGVYVSGKYQEWIQR